MTPSRRLIFILLSVSATIVAILGYAAGGGLRWWLAGSGAFILLLLWLMWRTLLKPAQTVENGFGMLRAQDFNSRLRRVGERHADRMADLFNDMAGRLREERLRLVEQEGFLNQLVEVSPMGVAVMDFDGRISLVNPAFMQMGSLVGNPSDYKGERLEDIEDELVREALDVPAGKSRVVRLGDTRIYRVSNLWFMERGFRRPFILVESLTEEVMKAERGAYEKVIRTMSHEVNNTVGGVASLLETMAEMSDDAGMREALESGESRCRSLGEFIRSYADVVKLAEPHLQSCELNAELERLLPFLGMMAGEGIGIERHLSDEPLMVRIDPVMFEQVLVNIVKNGVESIKSCGGSDGRIIVRTGFDEGRHPVLEISDNGAGISQETSRKLFTPFFSTKSNGRGIGLTLIAEILTRHGCRYSLQTSDLVTTFRIRF